MPPSISCILHSSLGRLRARVTGWSGAAWRQRLESRLAVVAGVSEVQANSLTGNVLVTFDPGVTSQEVVLAELGAVLSSAPESAQHSPSKTKAKRSANSVHRPPAQAPSTKRRSKPPVVIEGSGRARIALHGLDRNPHMVRRVLERLRSHRSIRARVQSVTGHIVVEFDHQHDVLEHILATVAHLEVPSLSGEDRPRHPLDRAPLLQSITRAIASLLGLIFLTVRRLRAPAETQAVPSGIAPAIAGIVNLLQGFPFVRNGLRRQFGDHAADLTLAVIGIVAQTAGNFPLAIIFTAVEALILVSEVTARRSAWRRYENSLHGSPASEPGMTIRLEAGTRVPCPARVIEGTGTATSTSGLPMPLAPGCYATAGAEVHGGPFVMELMGGEAFEPKPRVTLPKPTLYDRYHKSMGTFALIFAAFTALRTRSLMRTLEALLLLNPRTAVIGHEVANLNAASRTLRAGLTVVGTRADRPVQLPDVLLLSGPRLLADGLEIAALLALEKPSEGPAVLALAAAISAAAGSPWGHAFPPPGKVRATAGGFNGLWATAVVDGVRYYLGPPEDPHPVLVKYQSTHQGGYMLELRPYDSESVIGFVALKPALKPGCEKLLQACRRFGVKLELLPAGSPVAARTIAWRAGMTLSSTNDVMAVIQAHQEAGEIVAHVSDSAEAAQAFAVCDLAIAVARQRDGEFPARADLLAPDLQALADLLQVGALRAAAVRDGVYLSGGANIVGAVLGFFQNGAMGPARASTAMYLTALAAVGAGVFRLRGGKRPMSTLAYLADPRPERWGSRSVLDVFRAFSSNDGGLTTAEAESRRLPQAGGGNRDMLINALQNQLRTPIIQIMTGGACLTLALGQPLNTALLGITIGVNIVAGVWQEREVGRAANALEQMSASKGRVLRDGRIVEVPALSIVPGDILVLAAGDRVPADARIIEAIGLEVAEAALTGESLPVAKGPAEATDAACVVLEGSDVVVGSGRAVVVAIGRHTRMGATVAALNVDRTEDSPMGARLGQILRLALPVAGIGGTLAGLAGLVYGGAPTAQFIIGITTALAAIPEGLPLLAGVGQAGVARRLSSRKAQVRRIAAIEALGRVSVACTDKTGTLTEGRLALHMLADVRQHLALPATLPPEMRSLLLTAALASPNPDAADAGIHPTDAAVIIGAQAAGLDREIRALREVELPFDSSRAFRAARVAGRLCIKGAPERLVSRCIRIRHADGDHPLDHQGRQELLERAASFGERGLRMFFVAEGAAASSLDNPHGLTALGFVGIRDPLRPSVPDAVARCIAAGVRVIVITGDHPATARAIARDAGLLTPGIGDVVRASELLELSPDQMDRRLDTVAVVARATPLDKVRIIESLRRRGHVTAMTGDGVNDAPALRLADVGVAMGKGGTEVARQAADVILTDDDFATLVEALIEGRGFWRNMRNALALLLGGNAGELGLIVGASIAGFGSPLNAAQILIMNLITDTLPSLAVVLQSPEHRHLAGLAREGLSALDNGLRRDVFRRGVATGVPSLAAYLLTRSLAGPAQASAVAFTSVVATQLAQTLEVGRVEGILSRSVGTAVAASLGLLVSTVTVPPIARVLGVVSPSLFGWGIVGASSAAAVALSRLISTLEGFKASTLDSTASPVSSASPLVIDGVS